MMDELDQVLAEIEAEKRPVLEVISFTESAARAAATSARWMIPGKWPDDAYGVVGAEDKAGKTWSVGDLAVSVATGTPWFGSLAVGTRGPVTMFLGEGGERNAIRRLNAIAASKGVEPRDLDGLRLCYRVPLLSRSEHMQAVADELDEHPAALVILDPLYLAAAGARGSDLYQMGEYLYGIQLTCQEAECALVVTTHWNKTGEGYGASRFTGVGPGAWGRVLASAAVEDRRTEGRRSVVLLRWEFTGGEIQESTVRVRRTVWAESDELDSPLHYEVEVTDEFAGIDLRTGRPPRQARVLVALTGSSEAKPMTVRQIGDVVAEDGKGKGLRRQTIQEGLRELVAEGLVNGFDDGPGTSGMWWLQ
jgi:AAA domain